MLIFDLSTETICLAKSTANALIQQTIAV